ncbi:metal-dependent hydrolase [Marinobacter fonticola]|uniref:metal-dependent hydrolase n=1 Tax=Marinobacter fonticola TaxID=2603215 RepID=UPI001D0DADBD|nr:metal-dependent hydrolase [Marinobacter fonticola]
MDSVTQAALGATLGGVVLGSRLGRKAVLGGALLGTLPDMDVVLDYGSAVANFTRHRGFSHSLLVLFPLAVVLAYAFYRWRPQIGFPHWVLFTTLTLVTHPILDAFTTYGTQIFWPFGGPVAVGSLFIIDPAYTLPLLIGVAIFLWRPARVRPLAIAAVLSTAYIGWSVMAQQIVADRVQPLLAERNLTNAPTLIQPMPFSTLLWRITVLGQNDRLEIVTGFFDGDQVPRVEVFDRNRTLAHVARQLPEGQQLAWFTRDFLAYHNSNNELRATDIRLGLPGAHPFTFVLAHREKRRMATAAQ